MDPNYNEKMLWSTTMTLLLWWTLNYVEKMLWSTAISLLLLWTLNYHEKMLWSTTVTLLVMMDTKFFRKDALYCYSEVLKYYRYKSNVNQNVKWLSDSMPNMKRDFGFCNIPYCWPEMTRGAVVFKYWLMHAFTYKDEVQTIFHFLSDHIYSYLLLIDSRNLNIYEKQ